METICPWCAKHNDLTSAVMSKDEAGIPTPAPGDLTMCTACGMFAVFDESNLLRRPTRGEVIFIGTDPKCRAMRLAWKDIRDDAGEA